MNLYTGGSLMMRPGPQLSAGHRPAAQPARRLRRHRHLRRRVLLHQQAAVHRLLQNIGANAVGYAFKLALQSISPDIDKLLTELRDQINKINAMNINSCEAAQASGERRGGRVRQLGDERLRQHLPVPRQRLRPGRGPAHLRQQRAPVVKTAANSADPNVRNATFRQGQRHLARAQPGGRQHQPAGEGADRMSVIGTVILYPPDDDGSGASPRYAEPTIVGLRDLLLGRGASATEATSTSRCTSATSPPSA